MRRKTLKTNLKSNALSLVINADDSTVVLLVMINFRKQTWRHGPSPTQVDISTHLFAHVNTAGHDGFDCQLMNSRIIFTPDGRFKQSFGTAVSCRVYGHFP